MGSHTLFFCPWSHNHSSHSPSQSHLVLNCHFSCLFWPQLLSYMVMLSGYLYRWWNAKCGGGEAPAFTSLPSWKKGFCDLQVMLGCMCTSFCLSFLCLSYNSIVSLEGVSLSRVLTQTHTKTWKNTLLGEHSSQPLRHLTINSSKFTLFLFYKTQNFDSTLKYECNWVICDD